MKKSISIILAAVMLLSVALTGCGNKETAEVKEAQVQTSASSGSEGTGTEEGTEKAEVDLSEHVDLVMYIIGSEDNDYARISEKLNEKLNKDLNCTLTIKYIGFGEYDTKYGLLLTSGEQVDLIYSAGWLGMNQYVNDGAFMDIADMIPTYMPQTAASIDLESLKKINNGKVYYLPSNHLAHGGYGYIVRKDVMEQLGYESIDSFDDFLEFQSRACTELGFQDSLSQSMHEYDYHHLLIEQYTEVTGHYYVKHTDPEHKVYYISEVPELQDWLKSTEEWSNKGAWSKSALSNTDTLKMAEGLAAGWVHNVDKWVELCIGHPEYEFDFYLLETGMYVSPFGYDNMCVASTSQNPERALMALDLMRNDESYYMLLMYGEEGIDYEIDEATGMVKLLNTENFTADNIWGIRNDVYFKDLYGTPEKIKDIREEAISREKDNQLWLFVANTDAVKNELAAVNNVYSQYYVPLSMGYVEYEAGMAELNKALEAAGSEKVKAELQRQIDEYFANLDE